MADIEEVEQTLASTITDIINAAGPTPTPITVAAGWPTADDLNALLKGRSAHVSVFAPPGASSNVTRFQWDWQVSLPPSITTTAMINVAAGTVTFGGTVTLPFNVSVRASNKTYVYSAISGDTPALVAVALVTLIIVDQLATAVGGVLTVASAPPDLKCSLGGEGTLLRENVREKQSFQITVWAPTQAIRIAVSKSFEAALYALNYITLSDGTAGMLLHMRSVLSDNSETEGLYRRDIICTVEYGITETTPAWSVVDAVLSVTPVPGPPPIVPLPPII